MIKKNSDSNINIKNIQSEYRRQTETFSETQISSKTTKNSKRPNNHLWIKIKVLKQYFKKLIHMLKISLKSITSNNKKA